MKHSLWHFFVLPCELDMSSDFANVTHMVEKNKHFLISGVGLYMPNETHFSCID